MPAFYNRATLNYGGETIDSNTVQGELTAALALDKVAVSESYRPGDAVAFAVTIVNSGSTDAAALQLTEDLGAYAFGGSGSLVPMEYVDGSARYFVNGELQAAPEAESGAALTFRGLRAPAHGSATLLYAARANEYAPLSACGSILSTARLDAGAQSTAAPGESPSPAGNSGLPLFASAEIRPEQRARLSIDKRLTPSTVSAGEPLTYALTIHNDGPAPVPADEGATVTDHFDPLLDIRSVRYNGAEWGPENYSYDRATGQFATVPGRLNVPAATSTQDATTGRWQTEPGVSTIEITGTLR